MEAEKSSHDFFNPNLISESEISKKFINEVIACCLNPNIINSPRKDFMEESKRKAETYIKTVKVGAYSCSKGLEPVRKNILEKLRKRDNVELDESDIYLVAGGMDAYHHIISLFPKGTKVF
jgi:aspartate/methionine/tyrosine aminotransferase